MKRFAIVAGLALSMSVGAFGTVLSRLAPFASRARGRELFRSCDLHDADRNASVMEEVTASTGG